MQKILLTAPGISAILYRQNKEGDASASPPAKGEEVNSVWNQTAERRFVVARVPFGIRVL